MEAAGKILAVRKGHDTFALYRRFDGTVAFVRNDVHLGAWPAADEPDCVVKFVALLGVDVHDRLPASNTRGCI